MKVRKEPKAEILAFYTGGAKVHASTAHEYEELKEMMEQGIMNNQKVVVLDTINEDESVANDTLGLVLDKLLFYSVLIKNTSPIVSLSPDGPGRIVT